MDNPKSSRAVIHIFALLHAAAAWGLRLWVGDDQLVLTLLTVAMVVYLALLWGRPLGLAMSLAVMACFAGSYLGDMGAQLLFVRLGLLGYSVTTFVVTEILGWGTVLVVRSAKPPRVRRLVLSRSDPAGWRVGQIVFLTVCIEGFRCFSEAIAAAQGYDKGLIELLASTLLNVPLTLLILWSTAFVAGYLTRRFGFERHVVLGFCVEFAGLTLLSGAAAALTNLDAWGTFGGGLANPIWGSFQSILTVSIVSYYAAKTIGYFRRRAQEELKKQIERRNKAHYLYSQLKQQLNPHFLFNSLNVLDHLVQSDPDRASAFIVRLADIYRYQLNQEKKDDVPIDEELRFVEDYCRLLTERFGAGLAVEVEVDPDVAAHYRVVPCALQLLVENAVKHNVVSEASPLRIRIFVASWRLCVSNNLQPKSSVPDRSWGIGLKSIREQYKMLEGQDIRVKQSETEFVVSLPLIEH